MVIIKRPEEIRLMREAGRIVAEVLALMQEMVKPGVTTQQLNDAAETLIRKRGAIPSFLGYPPGNPHPFPATICASLNEVMVHGIPGPRVLEEGDIISVDVGAIHKGFHGDGARTFPVGKVSPEAAEIIAVAEGAFEAALGPAVAGNRLGDISAAIQQYVESRGYHVPREYTGHGIGRKMHEDPQIFNFGTRGQGLQLRAGMTLAVEPMVLIGTPHTHVLSDHWAVASINGKLTSHHENTIAIRGGEPEILTRL